MGVERRPLELFESGMTHQERTISVHAYSDLSYVSPVVFLYLLKECYVHGTRKATAKFRVLQQQVSEVLYHKPRPGPAIFVAHCLSILPIFEPHCEGLSHLMISALRRFLKTGTPQEDLFEAKSIAAKLFVSVVDGTIFHEERILVKIIDNFDIELIDIEKVLSNSDVKSDSGLDKAEAFIQKYILDLIDSESFMTAVTLLERFSIHDSGEAFLHKIVESKQYQAAEKWATFKGKQMLCVLVQEYIDKNLLTHAYDMIKKNKLRDEFPEVYHKGKESSLKKLAERGCWDVAESRANSDRKLLKYLVYLALEAGYLEKVDELCDRYSLDGFINSKEVEEGFFRTRFLRLDELAIDNIIWVDDSKGLQDATHHIEGCKVVGLDCEWKPNYEKGSKGNKVSIMQIASEKMVFILDLIKLFQDVPDILDDCLARILHSPRILKLGYNFQCDMKQLGQSYGNLGCFKHYEMLLDVQNVFKEHQGGLSGLAEKILGFGLNKTRRSSNWEQRPLTQNQLEYAALDAAVLIHIFWHIGDHSSASEVSDEHNKIEWKSHIVSHLGNQKNKKKNRSEESSDVGIYNASQTS